MGARATGCWRGRIQSSTHTGEGKGDTPGAAAIRAQAVQGDAAAEDATGQGGAPGDSRRQLVRQRSCAGSGRPLATSSPLHRRAVGPIHELRTRRCLPSSCRASQVWEGGRQVGQPRGAVGQAVGEQGSCGGQGNQADVVRVPHEIVQYPVVVGGGPRRRESHAGAGRSVGVSLPDATVAAPRWRASTLVGPSHTRCALGCLPPCCRRRGVLGVPTRHCRQTCRPWRSQRRTLAPSSGASSTGRPRLA